MSIKDEINQKESQIRGEISSLVIREQEYQKLKREYDRNNVTLGGHVVVNLRTDLRNVVNEAFPNLHFRHRVKVIDMSDATRVIVGPISEQVENPSGNYNDRSILYCNTYQVSGVNNSAFVVSVFGDLSKNDPREYAYMLILSDGRVAIPSRFIEVNPEYRRKLSEVTISAEELRNRIIKAEADARAFPNMVFTQQTTPRNTTSYSNSSSSSSGCYIATCVYGSYDCPEVWTLRRYRDDVLLSRTTGRMFVKMYYAISPRLVKWFGNNSIFKSFWKKILDKKVNKLNTKGVSGEKYLGD